MANLLNLVTDVLLNIVFTVFNIQQILH